MTQGCISGWLHRLRIPEARRRSFFSAPENREKSFALKEKACSRFFPVTLLGILSDLFRGENVTSIWVIKRSTWKNLAVFFAKAIFRCFLQLVSGRANFLVKKKNDLPFLHFSLILSLIHGFLSFW